MEVVHGAPSRLRILAGLLALVLCVVPALLLVPSLAEAATATDLGEGFPISLNASDHVLIGRLTIELDEGEQEENLAGPWRIWASGKATALQPLNGPEGAEDEQRHELTLENINDAGEAGGTSTASVFVDDEELAEDRPAVYSASGEGREIPLLQDTITNKDGEQRPVGGVGVGVDGAGDVAGIGVVQTGGKLVGRGFFVPRGSSPEVVGAADAPDSAYSSAVVEINAAGTMVGEIAELGAEEEPINGRFYLWKTPTSAGVPLNFSTPLHGIANDDTVLGERAGTTFMRMPTGKEVAVEGLTKPLGVNSLHQVIGVKILEGGIEHAAVWQGGKVTDLNELLPEHSGWVLQRATAINDSGDIAGVGVHEGHASAFLLPATAAHEELTVDSVEDTTTGVDSGSILGGDTLKIKGSGFELPDEGEAEVQFFFGGKKVSGVEVTPLSDDEIEVTAPDLSSLRGQVPEGADGLATNVRVQISSEDEGKPHTEISPSGLDGKGPDAYDALVPKVDIVADATTGADSGSILGGEELRIEGAGFGAPKGGKTTVVFSLGEETLAKVDATPSSATEITVPAPNLAKFASKIPPGREGLPLHVSVVTSSGAKEVRSKTTSDDSFEALLPKVDSVTEPETELNAGSILGGEKLHIKGSGFNVPKGGSAAVVFYLGGDPVKTVAVNDDPEGSEGVSEKADEIVITAPDLASLQDRIPEGEDTLPLDVVILIKDATGEEVLSPSNLTGEGDDVFEAAVPFVDSVTDVTTGKSSGSILGGDELKIKGLFFDAPPRAAVVVQFHLGEDVIKSVRVKSEGEFIEEEGGLIELGKKEASPTELTIKTPNLASLAKRIPADREGLPLNVTVAIETEGGELVESQSTFDGTGDDAFEALLPKVDSVTDVETKLNAGSILGGEKLAIKGSGFNVPKGGSAAVVFYLGGDPVKTVKVNDDPEGSEGISELADEIVITAPDLASLQNQIPEDEASLPLDVVVEIKDSAGETILSPSNLDGQGEDVFEVAIPFVESVIDETTGKSSGSILGGEELKVKGHFFNAPPKAAVAVRFYLGSDVVKTVRVRTEGEVVDVDEEGNPVTAPGDASPTELTIKTPDLVSLQKQIPAGKEGLPLNVTVAIETDKDFVESQSTFDGTGDDAFEALLPKVDSVIEPESGLSAGSLLGGETLKIKGSGFNVPEGGSAQVQFYLGGDRVKTVSVANATEESETITPNQIVVTAPDMASLQKQIPEGQDTLPVDVVVAIKDAAGEEALSPSSLDGQGDDVFEFTVPFVSSVTDETTGKRSGSIFGGETLKIKGLFFNAPKGAIVAVQFHLGEEVVKTVKVKTEGEVVDVDEEGNPIEAPGDASPTELTIKSPDLASLAKRIPSDKEGLALNLTVAIESKEDFVASSSTFDGAGEDAFEALPPKVSSVTDKESGLGAGSILGGEVLDIKGSGFSVPEGGSAQVQFYLGGDRVKTVDLNQEPEGGGDAEVDPNEIQLPAPDLSTLQDQIPEGDSTLALDVVVAIKDAAGEEVLSPSDLDGKGVDAFEVAIPFVESVTDQSTGKATGSIFGGEQLKVKGLFFNAPPGAVVAVRFYRGEDVVKTVKVPGDASPSELTIETPDLASLSSQVPDGKDGLPLNLTVAIEDEAGHEVESKSSFDGTGDDAFEALLPKVDSVTDAETGLNSASILGGEALDIKGSGFSVPEGGSAQVQFYLGGDRVKTVDVNQDPEGGGNVEVGPSEILLQAPNLASLQSQIPEGQSSLTVDVRVVILDGHGAEAASRVTSADQFRLDTLGITSEAEATFTVGQAGSFAITAQGAEPLTLKETGALPDGVSFEETAVGAAELAGTPAAGSAGVYHFTITAANGVDPDFKQSFTLTIQDVPGAPGAVTATAGVESAEVSWSAPSSDGQSEIESYVVTVSPGGESVTVDGTATSTAIDGLDPGRAYTFSVTAVNAVGEGKAATSNPVVATSTPIEDAESATSSSPDETASTDPVTSSDGATLTATGTGEGTLNVGVYASDPVPALSDGTSFFDVATSFGSSFTSVSFKICGIAAEATIDWWDPGAEAWKPASEQTPPSGDPPCITVTVDSTTSPSLSQLEGTVFAVEASSPTGTGETPAPGTGTHGENGSGSTGAPTAASRSTPSGVAGFTSKAAPRISFAGPARFRHGAVLAPLRCSSGSGSCAAVTLRLTATERHRGHRPRTIVIGQLTLKLVAGQSKTARLALNRAGKRLLNVRGSLTATLTAKAEGTMPKQQIVTLARPRKR
jgi:hypothetical protein